MPKIDLLKQGESPTLLHTSKGNELIEWLNAVLGLTVSPPGAGKFLWSKERSMLVLDAAKLGAGSAAAPHPFQARDASTGDALAVAIDPDSLLFASIRATDTLVITDLDATFPVVDGTMLWVELKFVDESEAIESVHIRSGLEGSGNWPNYDDPVSFDSGAENKRQTFAYRLIGYVEPIDPAFPDRLVIGDRFHFVQHLRSHLILCETCFESDTVRVLSPV